MPQLRTGDRAPDIELPDQMGRTVRLSDFAGRKVLLYFYPMAGTPACTQQACRIRDARDELVGLGVAPIGVSPDRPERLKRFDTTRGLKFALLSDPDFTAARAYGVLRGLRVLGLGLRWVRRSAFLIDERGEVLRAWYGVRAGDTVRNVTEALGGQDAAGR